MPIYHFEVVNTRTVTDEGGAELPDDIVAMDSANELARRLLQERPQLKNGNFSILVTKEEGEEVCRLPLDIVH